MPLRGQSRSCAIFCPAAVGAKFDFSKCHSVVFVTQSFDRSLLILQSL